MIDFLITSTISLVVFLGFYHLLLEKEKFHTFKRFYLLASVIVSFWIPFLNFEIIREIPVAEISEPVFMEMMPSQVVFAEEKISVLPIVLWTLYGIITVALFIRFGKNILELISKTRKNPTVKYKNAKLVLVEEKTIPHTFWNSVFVNFDDYNKRNIEDELYTHELVHVTQKHTFDILFIETLKTVFWFNPLFYFYKKAIQLNHEFLADEEVVKSCNDVPFYQTLLLQKNSVNSVFLTSNLNYLVTKKRLIMMTKNTSKTLAVLKKVAVIPILCGLIYFFCVEIIAQEKAVNAVPAETPTVKNSNDKDKIRDSYYSGVWVKIFDERTNRKSVTLYEDLSLEDKRKYLDFIPEIMIQKEIPEPLFEKMKTKDLAIWINGKAVNKEEIRKYKRTDFGYYTYSFVHKNARSKRFPQEYQYVLYTKKYFDENLKNSHLHFKGDTIKIGYANYETAMKKSLIGKVKSDTVAWYTEGKDGYNLYINEQADKKSEVSFTEVSDYMKQEKTTQKVVVGKYDEKPTYTGKNKNEKLEVVAVGKESDLEIPSFPGGISEFYKFFGQNFKIPKDFKGKDKLIVFFIVEKDGSLTNIDVKQDLGFGIKEETIRVLKMSPKWIPATAENETVRYQYSLPISIASE